RKKRSEEKQMKLVKRISMGLGSVVVIASFFMLVAPKAARAIQQQLVQLVNTTSNPAIVSNMNDPGRIPYQSTLMTTPQTCPGGINECLFTFPAVPAGHRLVIQHVSGFIQAAPGAVPGMVALLLTNNQTATTTTRFVLTSENNADLVVAFDQPVLVYADEG